MLPGGYQLISIGAEDLKVSKDGYSFIIRRSSSSSGPSNSVPCETIAQNSRNVEANKLEQPNHPGRRGGIAGSRRKLITNQIGQASGQQGMAGSQGHRKPYDGWGNKTIVEEGESAIDPGFLEPPTDNDDPAEKEQ